jgi:hypothetical protein
LKKKLGRALGKFAELEKDRQVDSEEWVENGDKSSSDKN